MDRTDLDPRRQLSAVQRREIMDRPCAYCGDLATAVDHIVPWSRGGRTTVENSAPACKRCNEQKFDSTPEEWRAWCEENGMPWPPRPKMEIAQGFLRDAMALEGVTDEMMAAYWAGKPMASDVPPRRVPVQAAETVDGRRRSTPNAKLTEQQVREIRHIFATTDRRTADVAREYDVSNLTISFIVKRRTWKWVD